MNARKPHRYPFPVIARNAVSFGACDLGDHDPPAYKAISPPLTVHLAVLSDSVRIGRIVKQISGHPPPDRQDGYYDVIILFLMAQFIFAHEKYNILTTVIINIPLSAYWDNTEKRVT